MIEFKTDSIFDSSMKVLVNPVNCVGVMGAGLALEFKKRYPQMFQDYKKDCAAGKVTLGQATTYKIPGEYRHILCLPTKNHWKDKAYINDVLLGLHTIANHCSYWKLSVAIPKVGCGLGGLDWNIVKPKMTFILNQYENLVCEVYE